MVPVVAVASNTFSVGTDGNQTAEGLDVGQGIEQFRDQPFALDLVLFTLRDVLRRADIPQHFSLRIEMGVRPVVNPPHAPVRTEDPMLQLVNGTVCHGST